MDKRPYNHWFWHRGWCGAFWNWAEGRVCKINTWIWQKRWGQMK